MRLQGLEELYDLQTFERTVVQTEQTIASAQSRNGGNGMPVEMKLYDRCLSLRCPTAHPGRLFRQPRFVDKDNQPSFAGTLFLSAGQVLRFHVSTAVSSRSMARRSGRCGEKPSASRMRQTCASLYATPKRRSISKRTRLSVHSSVPKPCSLGFSNIALRNCSRCAVSRNAGRPLTMPRSASIPPSSSRAFH